MKKKKMKAEPKKFKGKKKIVNKKIGKVMTEFKEGALHSGSKQGPVVTDKDQAVAIAISEAKRAKKKKKKK